MTKSNCKFPQKKIKEVDEREHGWNHMLHMTCEIQKKKKKIQLFLSLEKLKPCNISSKSFALQ